MELHSKIIGNHRILIYGEQPMAPMKIEVSLSNSYPHLDEQIFSFENYDQAYDLCKDRKDVGLIFLFDCLENKPHINVHDNLTRNFEGDGLPAVTVLITQGDTISLSAARLLAERKEVIGPYSLDQLTDINSAPLIFDEILNHYAQKVREFLLPLDIEDTIKSMAKAFLSEESLIFQERAIRLVSSKLNLSILENEFLPLFPSLLICHNKMPELISHRIWVQSFIDAAKSDRSFKDLNEINNTSETLLKKITSISTLLDGLRLKGELESHLNELKITAPPHKRALLKGILSSKDNIIKIGQEVGQQSRTLRIA